MKKYFTLFLLLFFSLYPLASQNQEIDEATKNIVEEDLDDDVMSLFQIEKLIRQTDYTEALFQLHKYIERYPERFDNAQRLVRIIMNRRSRYSVLTEKAIKVSTENPEDHITPSEIILEMRTLEKNPPEDVKKVIELLEDMHLFKYYAYLFDKIETESAELCHADDITGAITKVQEGFWIYKDEFLEDFANNKDIISEAEKIEKKLNSLVEKYKQEDLSANITSLTTQFIKSVNEANYTAANDQLGNLRKAFSNYSSLRNDFLQIIKDYQKLYDKQKKIKPDLTDACYVAFMQRFVSGLTSIDDSGLVGVMDYVYNSNINKIKVAVVDLMKKQTSQYLTVLPKDILSDKVNFDDLNAKTDYKICVNRFGSIVKEVNGFTSFYKNLDNTNKPVDTDYNLSIDYICGLSNQTSEICKIAQKVKQEEIYQKQILSSFNNSAETSETSANVTKLFESASRVNNIIGEREKLLSTNFAWSNDKNQNWENLTTRYDTFVNQIFDFTSENIVSAWKKISESYIQDANKYTKELDEYVKYSETYQKGFSEQIDKKTFDRLKTDPKELLEYAKTHKPASDNSGTVYHYPELTLHMANVVTETAEKYQESLQKAQEQLEKNANMNKEWQTNAEVNKIIKQSEQSLADKQKTIQNITLQTKNATEKATNDYNQAQVLKRNGDAIVEQAEEEFNKNNLNKAENLIDDAIEKYNESLSYSENIDLRTQTEQVRYDFSNKILKAKNEIVVRESRELYNKAKSAQDSDRYDDAQTYITAAITKWSETHDDTNPEFQDFLEIVNTAVSMKTGRILLPSDPLYAEMSQLLSSAYQYFEQGSSYYKQKNYDEGKTAFSLALDNIQKIKQVYPINQEASILQLKIDRMQNPQKFETDFENKVKTAIAKTRKADTKAEGYNELLIYYDLNPNYKGLKNTIANVEIELGMRQKPVDNTAVTRSNKLTQDAQSIFNSAGNNQDKLLSALTKINEAIKLNPNNTKAQKLKDKINTKLGGSKTTELTAADEAIYNQARNAYLQKKYDEAKAYIDQLWQKPAYRSIEKVKSLKKSIDSKV